MAKSKAARIIFGNKEKKQFPDPEGLEREKPSSAIEGSTQPLGFETRLRGKFSEQVSEIGLETRHKQDMKNKGMRNTFAKRSSVRPKHLQHPAPIRGGHYKQTPQMEKPHYEEVENMTDKSYREFVTEAKRGRPRKLRPGEKADTEHLQDQLSKLTHPNHVQVHFADGSKHVIPRGHANKALQHLASLKPEHRADRVAFMHGSHENFYKGLAGHPTPSKKKTITLAGPKLRKEEVELDEAKDSDKPERSEHSWPTRRNKQGGWHWANSISGGHASAEAADRHYVNSMKKMSNTKVHIDDIKPGDKPLSKPVGLGGRSRGIPKWAKSSVKEEAEQIDELSIYKMQAVSKEASRRNKDYSDPKGIKHQVYGTEVADDKIVKKAGKYNPSTAAKIVDKVKDKLKGMSMKKKMAEEAENDDGWYAHKEMHGKDAVSREDWKKGIRKKPAVKKEEVELDEMQGEWHKKMKQQRAYAAKKLTDKAKEARDKASEKIDETKAIQGTHASKAHAAPSISPSKVKFKGKGTIPKAQNIKTEDYAPLEKGEAQAHPDQKTVDASSRRQGAEKPKKPKMQLSKEEWELYDTLSDANKIIFEKMDQKTRDDLMDKYFKNGGEVKRVPTGKRPESSKSFPASKRSGTIFNKGAKRVHLQNKGVKGK